MFYSCCPLQNMFQCSMLNAYVIVFSYVHLYAYIRLNSIYSHVLYYFITIHQIHITISKVLHQLVSFELNTHYTSHKRLNLFIYLLWLAIHTLHIYTSTSIYTSSNTYSDSTIRVSYIQACMAILSITQQTI